MTEAMVAVSSDAAPALQWFARISQARVAVLEGRFDDAQRINDDALKQAQDLREADGTSWWGSIAMPLAMLRGDTAAVVDAIGDFSSRYPVHPGWWVTYAVSLATVGRVEEAREVLNQRSPDPEELADSVFPFMAISGLAAACPYLEDDRLAARIADILRPYRSYWAHAYSNVAGPVTFFLALCAAATGDLDDSIALYEASERVLVDFGCYGLLPLCRLSYANVLQRRGLDDDHMRAMHLLDQVRQGATTIQAPNLVAMAERLTARSTLETK